MQQNNQYQPPEPTGIDYLNHIAPPPQSTGFDKKSKIILVVAAVVSLFSLILIGLTAANQANSGPSPLNLVAKLQKLETLSSEYGNKLRTTAVQDANSSLSVVLITANRSIVEPLQAYSIDIKKQSEQIAALDPSAEIEQKLDDAHLNSMLDEVYAREMTYQLDESLVMMKRLEATTSVPSMKGFLVKTIADFENLKKQFASGSEG